MRMLCYKCDYSWNYKGKYTEGEGHITCPKCFYKIRVDKALIEGPSQQELLTNLPNKKRLSKGLPKKLLTTKLEKGFEAIRDKDGFIYLVDRKIAKQFKEAQEETLVPSRGIEEEDLGIKVLPIKPEIIRIIPIDPIKILEHQRSFF